MFYQLNKANRPIPQPDIIKWEKWVKAGGLLLKETVLGKWRITTVFSGLDFCGRGPTFLTYTDGGKGTEAGKAVCSPDYETAMSCHEHLVTVAGARSTGTT